MKEPEIKKHDLEKWADYLLNHSLGGVKPGERVMIKGERIGWPLMALLEKGVVRAGGLPDVYLIPPNNERGRVWSSTMAMEGKKEQIDAVPEWHKSRYEAMDKYVEVLGAEDPSSYAGLTADQTKNLAEADKPFAALRLSKPWVITLFPTPGFAEMEGLSLQDYTQFIVGASTTDPTPLLEAEKRIAPTMNEGKKVTIITEHPHEKRKLTLTMDISHGLAQMSYGLRNFPDGEVFTSPDARSTQGEIFVDLPVHYGGKDIQGIYLKFKDGVIQDYRADKGGDQLAAIIETDDGSKRLGEVAFGMNPGLDRVLKHPLFVEKVGGTLHIAIGASYEQCYTEDPSSKEGQEKIQALQKEGVLNRSAQHVDIVTDFREGGAGRKVTIDDTELVVSDAVWAPKKS